MVMKIAISAMVMVGFLAKTASTIKTAYAVQTRCSGMSFSVSLEELCDVDRIRRHHYHVTHTLIWCHSIICIFITSRRIEEFFLTYIQKKYNMYDICTQYSSSFPGSTFTIWAVFQIKVSLFEQLYGSNFHYLSSFQCPTFTIWAVL